MPKSCQTNSALTISVVTPVMNGGQFIEACIANVIAQGVERVEHIVVDGGSTDRSYELALDLAAQYSHLKVLYRPGESQSESINTGTETALGQAISILNVDDYYEPNALKHARQELSRLPSPALVVGNCAVRGTNGEIRYLQRPSDLRLETFLSGVAHPVNPSAYLYHRALHERIGGYRADLDYTMDVAFIYRALECCNGLAYVDEHWGNFVEHEKSKTVTDKANGKQQDRMAEIRREFYQTLPFWRKLRVLGIRLRRSLKRRASMLWRFN